MKEVEVTLRLNEKFVSLLRGTLTLRYGSRDDSNKDTLGVLGYVVLGEAMGAHYEQTYLKIPPEWRRLIDPMPEKRVVYQDGKVIGGGAK
jgi:hypothetical protein